MNNHDIENLRRWRLILGQCDDDNKKSYLDENDLRMDAVLQALYNSDRSAGLGSSCPNVNRWLGDIRSFFPTPCVQLLQKDALTRLKLNQMLLEPELLKSIEPDVHLVATLISLNRVIPSKTKATARMVVKKVVDELERKLRSQTIQAIQGSLSRATRTAHPKLKEIDWHRTIQINLKNYDAHHKTIIAERLSGYGRKQTALRDIILCVDQSGSMASSVVYSSIFGAVIASMKSVSMKMVVFDTAVVDLTPLLSDPVDLLFGTQLGGGTDINQALAYCQNLVTAPSKTILVLITDLYEGGDRVAMLKRAAALVASGVQVICLLALSDSGAPCSDERNAQEIAALGIPTFACTPDLFPDLMAAAIQKRDIQGWAAQHDILAQRKK